LEFDAGSLKQALMPPHTKSRSIRNNLQLWREYGIASNTEVAKGYSTGINHRGVVSLVSWPQVAPDIPFILHDELITGLGIWKRLFERMKSLNVVHIKACGSPSTPAARLESYWL
jgi:hypothetical protein